MPKPHWYQPVSRGLEAKIADKLAFLRQLDEEAASLKTTGIMPPKAR
jgi:putative ATPase